MRRNIFQRFFNLRKIAASVRRGGTLSTADGQSAAAIRDAIAKAEEVIANRGSEEDLAEAYEALQNALNNAQLKPATPVTPENPDTGDGAPFALPLVLTLAAGAVLALRRRYGER